MTQSLEKLSASANVAPRSWSRLQFTLHWLVVGLIVLQYFDSEGMEAFFDATFEGEAASPFDIALGWSHIIVGSAILAAMGVRLLNRTVRGRPAADEDEPAWTKAVASVVHVLLYATLLVMPILGLLAWLTGAETFADLHTTLWVPLLVLVTLHVAGALVQHFWFGTNVLRRMTSPRTH